MEIKAEHRMARISAFKAREVTRYIQGLPVAEAMELLEFTPKKAARLIQATLKSAIANAENNNGLDAENLFVKSAVVGEGMTIKRYRPRARGGAGHIRKRTSHIRVILDERDIEAEEAAKAAKKASKKDKREAAAKKADAKKED